MGESKTRNSGIMSHDELGPLGSIVFNPNLPLLQARAHQHHISRHVRQITESLRVRKGLNLMKNFQISKIINKYLMGEDDDDAVAAETNAFDFRAEREFADAAGLVVVPDHDLVGRVARVGAAADEGEDVAPE